MILYNRYIPNSAVYEQVEHRHNTNSPPPPPPHKGAFSPDGIAGRLGGLLKQLHIKEWDSGDILLVLILLFLFLESDDNMELVITLGLILAFGLLGKDRED